MSLPRLSKTYLSTADPEHVALMHVQAATKGTTSAAAMAKFVQTLHVSQSFELKCAFELQ